MSGEDNLVPKAEFAFYLHQAEQLKETMRRFTLTAEEFSLFNPNTRTCPIFRSQRDMEIARKMYLCAGIFWNESDGSQHDGNPWSVKLSTMFHMANDSGQFLTHSDLTEEGWELVGNVFSRGDERYLPLYEAKLFHQYDHRFATFDGVSEKETRSGNARPMREKEKNDSTSVSIPRYWVHETEVYKKITTNGKKSIYSIATDANHKIDPPSRETNPFAAPIARGAGTQLALRRLTRATDERTGICTMTPIVGLSDSGITVTIGSWYSEILRARRIKEP